MNRLRLFLAALLIATAPGLRPAPAAAAAAPVPPAASAVCPVCGHDCCCPEVCAKILSERRAVGCAARTTSCRMDARPSTLFLSGRDADLGAPALTLTSRPPAPPAFNAASTSVSFLSPGRTDRDVPTPPPRAAA